MGYVPALMRLLAISVPFLSKSGDKFDEVPMARGQQLNVKMIERLKEPGKYGDGRNLYPSGFRGRP
jgi:hypothetical protein